jgi:hypothetical protein
MPLMRLLRPVVADGRILREGETMERSEEDALILEAQGTATRFHRPAAVRRQMPGWGREAKVSRAPEPVPANRGSWDKK